jgi:class 3 adenylate cyclase
MGDQAEHGGWSAVGEDRRQPLRRIDAATLCGPGELWGIADQERSLGVEQGGFGDRHTKFVEAAGRVEDLHVELRRPGSLTPGPDRSIDEKPLLPVDQRQWVQWLDLGHTRSIAAAPALLRDGCALPAPSRINTRREQRIPAMHPRASSSGRRLVTVLFTDIVSSTEMAARLGDRQWRELLAVYRGVVRRTLRRTGGREIDDAGDGFFAVFDHPAGAIACACNLRDEVRTNGLEVRSGIHMGEVETVGAKLGGIAVHIGARVCARAGPGQVLVSGTIRDVVRGSDYEFVDLGEHELKGVPGEMQLFSVTLADAEQVHEGAGSRRRYFIIGASGLAIVAAAALVILLTRGGGGTSRTQVPRILTVAGTGVSGDGPDGRAATATDLAHPIALATDSAGRLYVVDGNRVRRINADGTVTTIAGTGHAGFSGDRGPATSADLDAPQSIAIDSAGDIYIADSQNNRVRRVDPQGIITTIAGSGQAGYGGDGGPATKATLADPTGVIIGFGNTILIADKGNNRVRAVDATGTIATFAGTGDPGYAGDAGPATSALLNDPQCLAVDAKDNVYVADTLNDRVRRIAVDGTISTVAGTDVRSFSGDHGLATDASLQLATGPLSGGGCLAVDAAGDLFIADALNNRVREVAVGGIITTVAGDGRAGSFGDNAPATHAGLDLPLGVTADSVGLYIAESDGHRVRLVV